jgi:hypothetical protein
MYIECSSLPCCCFCLFQSPALNAALTSLLSNIGKSTHHEEQPVLQRSSAGATRNIALSPPRPASAPHVESPAASSRHLAPASSSMPVVARLTGGSSSQASLNPSSSQGSLMRVGPGPGSEASTAAAAAAVPAGPGQLLLPGLVWGLCSPSTGLLQPGWVWLLAAGLPPGLRQEWRLLFSRLEQGGLWIPWKCAAGHWNLAVTGVFTSAQHQVPINELPQHCFVSLGRLNVLWCILVMPLLQVLPCVYVYCGQGAVWYLVWL